MLKKEAPRLNEFKIEKPVRPFKNRQKTIKSVRLEKINIDEEYEEDIKSGKGFLITNEEAFDKKENRTIDGLYSPLYGVDTFSDKTLDTAYRCECGELVGAINENDICDKCNGEVKFCDADLSISGYIPLGKYVVINPACYLDLESLIGGVELKDIIKFNNKFNVNGKNVSTKSKSSPYKGIGMMEFYKNFDEIIDYYHNKKKKTAHYENILKFRDAVFTHYVNPYSSLLRPLVKEDSRMCLFKVNTSYGIILANANNIRDELCDVSSKLIIIENALYEIQEEFNNIFDILVKNDLNSKNGHLRGKICSARVDFSARIVIAPAIGHAIDEISLPYIAGVELMRPLLIRELSKLDGINVRDANSMIDQAIRTFSKRIWLLMNYILHNSKHPPRILIQRSPSLLQESIRFMRIREIKMDYYDLTMSLPIGLLDGMGGDFDGDVLSAIMVFDKRLTAAWDPVHSPVNHFVSRHDGRYNGLHSFIKDTAVILSELWEVGKNNTYYSEWASEKEKNEAINKGI